MKHNLSKYNILGVINVTPNSFSDSATNLDPHILIENLNEFSRIQSLVLDIGLESTAPMNQAISLDEEIARFEYFDSIFKTLDNLKLEIISLDTYKITAFDYFYTKLKSRYPKLKFIFNDVSGVFDEEIKKYILDHPDIYYVYCATRIKDRETVHAHVTNILTSPDIIAEVGQQFINVNQWFCHNNLGHQLILDPGFGFSKTFEDNWALIKNFKALIEILDANNIDNCLLIGLSKKSFLQKILKDSYKVLDNKVASEFIHFNLILEFLSHAPVSRFIFRVHDPHLVIRAINYFNFKTQI